MRHTTTEKERERIRTYSKRYYYAHREEIIQKRKEQGWNKRNNNPLYLGEQARERIENVIQKLEWRTDEADDIEYMMRCSMMARKELSMILDGETSELFAREFDELNPKKGEKNEQ